jgi:hypothetical protein
MLIFLALQGAPYIHDISRLRVKNVLNTVDNIRGAKKGPLRGKKRTPTIMGHFGI